MDEKEMIDDLIAFLDEGMGQKGVGHVNVKTSEDSVTKDELTMGCTDCSNTPLACSVPTLHQGLDDYR